MNTIRRAAHAAIFFGALFVAGVAQAGDVKGKVTGSGLKSAENIAVYQTLQILSVTLFEKTPILQALQTFDIDDNLLQDANQLILFNL
jgi:hypothetical protein